MIDCSISCRWSSNSLRIKISLMMIHNYVTVFTKQSITTSIKYGTKFFNTEWCCPIFLHFDIFDFFKKKWRDSLWDRIKKGSSKILIYCIIAYRNYLITSQIYQNVPNFVIYRTHPTWMLPLTFALINSFFR